MPIKQQAPLEAAYSGGHIDQCRSYGAIEFLRHGFYKYVAPDGAGRRTSQLSWARFGLALGSSRFRSLGGGAAGKFEVSGSKFKVGDRGGRLPDRTPFSTGDWKVSGTRRQECRRYVAQAFQPAGSGDFSVAGASPQPAHTIKTSARMRPSGLAITKRTCRVRGFTAFIFGNHHLYER